MKAKNYMSKFQDHEWIQYLAFFMVNITGYLNELNVKMQGNTDWTFFMS